MWNGRMRHGSEAPEPAVLRFVGCTLLLLASSAVVGTLAWDRATNYQKMFRVAVSHASTRLRWLSREVPSGGVWSRKLLQNTGDSAEAEAVVELAFFEAKNIQAESPLPHVFSLDSTHTLPGATKVAADVEMGFGLMLGALDAAAHLYGQFDQPYWGEGNRVFVNQQEPGMGDDDEKLQDLIHHILPEEDIDEQYQSCAVVGNSGNLLLGKFGKAIDRHDAVFRVNGAPVGGAFKAYVGEKATYRFLNHDWSFRSLLTANKTSQLPGEAAVFYDSATMPAMYAMVTKQGKRGLLLSPELATRSHQAYVDLSTALYESGILVIPGEQNLPTAGWTALYAAMAMCRQVDVYGFSSPIPDGSLNRYHDWGVARRDNNFRAQSFIIRLLEKSSHVRLCLPYHSSSECSRESSLK